MTQQTGLPLSVVIERVEMFLTDTCATPDYLGPF